LLLLLFLFSVVVGAPLVHVLIVAVLRVSVLFVAAVVVVVVVVRLNVLYVAAVALVVVLRPSVIFVAVVVVVRLRILLLNVLLLFVQCLIKTSTNVNARHPFSPLGGSKPKYSIYTIKQDSSPGSKHSHLSRDYLCFAGSSLRGCLHGHGLSLVVQRNAETKIRDPR